MKMTLLLLALFFFFSVGGQTANSLPERSRLIQAKNLKTENQLRTTSDPEETAPGKTASNILQSNCNLPRPGDQVLKQEANYVEPGPAGINRIWDFRQVTLKGGNYEVNYFLRPDSTRIGAEDATLHAYITDSSSWKSKGYENAYSLVKYEKSEEIMPFPFSYGMKTGGYYYGKGKYCDRMEISEAGLYYQEADASGTLILPGGDTLTGVLRVHRLKEATTRYFPFSDGFRLDGPSQSILSLDSVDQRLAQDSIIRLYDIYQWYARGYRYPVFEVISSYIDREGERIPDIRHSFLFHPEDQKILPEDPTNLALRKDTENNPTGISPLQPESGYACKVYPNPVWNELYISLKLQKPEEVHTSLYDMQGRLLYQGTPTKGDGQYFEVVDMSRMDKGTYLLKVDAADKSVREKIVKQ